MANGVGRALWEIYEDVVKEAPNEVDGGVAGATLKFIAAFEQELETAKIDLYCKSALHAESKNKAKIRPHRLSSI